jgi:hypothetical protein
MAASEHPHSRTQRAVEDLIITEMFLVQATIESATAIGSGLSELGRQITTTSDGATPADSIPRIVQRIASDAVEPYTSRFRYLKDLKRDAD